jgi:SAM-dependent methyltransferase
MSAAKSNGDFTGLAENYARYRPGYSESVTSALLGLLERSTLAADVVDVGAGTGIWTRMVARRGWRSVTAVEPNAEMRAFGAEHSRELGIRWIAGCGERTDLPDGCCDLVTMASSFHWVDFERGTREFHRLLAPSGRFAALWNTRDLAASPLLREIEEELYRLEPALRRVSSGGSSHVERCMDELGRCPRFDDLVYLEGRHVQRFTPPHYEGVWRSVHDVQTQLGPQRFEAFLRHVRERTEHLASLEATYVTRAWSVRRALR